MMLDLNNEKITNEEKADLLLQQVDKRYKEKRLRFNGTPFHRYWILDYHILKYLNEDAEQNEGIFWFHPDDLEGYDELFSNCVLYEADRINEGDWDRFYNRWSGRTYIRCFVVLSNSPIYGVEEKGLISAEVRINKGQTPSTDERIIRFPKTWNSDGTMKKSKMIQGVIEFDPSLLKQVEHLCNAANIALNGKNKNPKKGWTEYLGCFERPMWRKRSDFNMLVDNELRHYFQPHNKKGKRRINKRGFS